MTVEYLNETAMVLITVSEPETGNPIPEGSIVKILDQEGDDFLVKLVRYDDPDEVVEVATIGWVPGNLLALGCS